MKREPLRPSGLHKVWWLTSIAAAIALALAVGTGVSARASAAGSAPAPFLYRPYYGSASVLSRSISLFDHDKPWYANDGTFVRYDGQTFTNTGFTGCTPYISCYDGHNGYDINMFFEPVLSAAAGTVIRAGWYDPANHLDGGGLWVAIDHGNGYVTMYLHLSAVLVTVGEHVGAQWQIGTSGSTGDASGPHLHFSAFQMPGWQATDPFGWQAPGQADPNPTPDYYLWVSHPQAPTQSPNLGADNGQPHPGATVIDNNSPGFGTTGTWTTAAGPGTIDGSMRWTATSTGGATATATWTATLPAAGTYEVGAYIDPIDASSQWAPYTITSQSASGSKQTTTVWIDQDHIGTFQGPYGTVNTGPQWVSLGTYTFGTSGTVSVSNATGEAGAQLGADAVEFVPVGGAAAPQPPTATPTPATPTPLPMPTVIPSRHRSHR